MNTRLLEQESWQNRNPVYKRPNAFAVLQTLSA